MFCKYCGKETDNKNGVCDECANKDKTSKPMGKMYGFGKAIAGICLGVVSSTFELLAFIYGLLTPLVPTFYGFSIAFWILGLPPAIISLVYGLSSLKLTREAKVFGVRTIPTMAVGIASIVTAGLSFAFFTLTGIPLFAFM